MENNDNKKNKDLLVTKSEMLMLAKILNEIHCLLERDDKEVLERIVYKSYGLSLGQCLILLLSYPLAVIDRFDDNNRYAETLQIFNSSFVFSESETAISGEDNGGVPLSDIDS
jgi:hypothetical protein